VGGTGQIGSPGGLILRALEDEHPAAALARLQPSPRIERLLSQLFVVALRRCFTGHDGREITAYVHDLLLWLGRPARGRLAREAEALIRAALGEPALAAGIAAERRHGIICTVVGDLARPPGASAGTLAGLVVQAETRVERFTPRRSRP
jgi:hypothetical protein